MGLTLTGEDEMTIVLIFITFIITVLLYAMYRILKNARKAFFIARKLETWTNIERLIEDVSSKFGDDINIETFRICFVLNKARQKGTVIVRINSAGREVLKNAKEYYKVSSDAELSNAVYTPAEMVCGFEKLIPPTKHEAYKLIIILLQRLHVNEFTAKYLEVKLNTSS